MRFRIPALVVVVVFLFGGCGGSSGSSPSAPTQTNLSLSSPLPTHGLQLVNWAVSTEPSTLDPLYTYNGYDQEIFDNLWKTWPAELRNKAESATPAERRRMTFARYGLMERPGSDGTGTALGYLPDGNGGWVMNCLACHTGKVAGRVIPGLPNSHFALETLTEEVRLLKLQMGKPLTHLDLGSLKMPLGQSRGTTNSVIFGVALGALRDIVHALRGWPTPLGAAINSSERVFDDEGQCLVPRVSQMLDLIAAEVLGFLT